MIAIKIHNVVKDNILSSLIIKQTKNCVQLAQVSAIEGECILGEYDSIESALKRASIECDEKSITAIIDFTESEV